jgi:hypothetical protein
VNESGEDYFESSVNLVVTSPPYGDSGTTVAYAQFSWLSNSWLGLDDKPPGKNYGKVHDHGSGFRIARGNMVDLFEGYIEI